MKIANSINEIRDYLKETKYGLAFIRCPNPLAAKSLTDHLHSKGYNWRTSGDSLQDDFRWGLYKSDSVYILDNTIQVVNISNLVKKAGVVYAKR